MQPDPDRAAPLRVELASLAETLESRKAELGAVTASLEAARAEHEHLRDRDAGRDGGETRAELVAMIERLADDIAQASGAEPLPQIATLRPAGKTPQAAAAE